MVACKFEPHDNWLPPCYRIPFELEKALINQKVSSCMWKISDIPILWSVKADEISFIKKMTLDDCSETDEEKNLLQYVPFHLVTYHSIPDKSIADCVEALIGKCCQRRHQRSSSEGLKRVDFYNFSVLRRIQNDFCNSFTF